MVSHKRSEVCGLQQTKEVEQAGSTKTQSFKEFISNIFYLKQQAWLMGVF